MSFDEIYDEMLHDEFGAGPSGRAPRGAHTARTALSEPSRARTVGIVASGGIACAVVGALLGGLGGEFGVTPASAQSLNNSTQFVPLASVADAAYQSQLAASPATAKAASAAFSSLGNTVTTLPTELSGTLSPTSVLPAVPSGVVGTALPGVSTPAVTTADTNSTDQSSTAAANTNAVEAAVGDLSGGLSGILTNLAGALSGIASMPSDPSDGLNGVVTSLAGISSDLVGTLSNLGSVLAVPTAATSPLSAIGLPSVNAPSSSVSGGLSHGSSGVTSPVTSIVKPVLSVVTGALNLTTAPVLPGSAGFTLPSLPTVPLSTDSSSAPLPSLPVSLPTAPALPTALAPVSQTLTTVTSTVSGVVSGVTNTVGTVVTGVTGVLDGAS